MAKTKTAKVEEPKKSTTSKKTSVPVKETAAKKPEAKTKPVLEKVPVSARQIGKNLNVVVGNEKFTRMGTKEELEGVKLAIQTYDSKPTKSNYQAMINALRPETAKKEVEKEEIKAKAKLVKNDIKNSPKDTKKKIVVSEVVKEIDEKMMTTEELDEMQKAITRQREKIAPVAQKSATVPKGREW